MNSLRIILGKFAKDIGIDSGVALNKLRKQWISLVGKPIAVHTYPDSVKSGSLSVVVDTPQWMHHLGFYKNDILDKLKPFGVNSIRFRLGRIPEYLNEELKPEDSELSEEDLQYIDNTVKSLKDDELRDKFRTLIRHGLSRRKK
jgi:hypothetical protein